MRCFWISIKSQNKEKQDTSITFNFYLRNESWSTKYFLSFDEFAANVAANFFSHLSSFSNLSDQYDLVQSFHWSSSII